MRTSSAGASAVRSPCTCASLAKSEGAASPIGGVDGLFKLAGSLNGPSTRWLKRAIPMYDSSSEPIVSYSIVMNRPTDYFTPEVAVYLGNPSAGNVTSESFACEGPLPGNGIGCKGGASGPDATGPRFVVGGIGLSNNPCAKHAKGAGWKTWLVVTTLRNDGVNKPFYISSEPFRLGTSCKAGARNHRH